MDKFVLDGEFYMYKKNPKGERNGNLRKFKERSGIKKKLD